MGVKPKLLLSSIENRVSSDVPILVIHHHATFISFKVLDEFISILNNIFSLMPINIFPFLCLPISPLVSLQPPLHCIDTNGCCLCTHATLHLWGLHIVNNILCADIDFVCLESLEVKLNST